MAKDLTPPKPLQAKRPLSSAQCLTRNAYNKKGKSLLTHACVRNDVPGSAILLVVYKTHAFGRKILFSCRGGGVLAFLLARFVARAMRACVPLPAGQLPFAYAASVYFVHRAFMPVVVL
jgi:hypothetical protein